MASMDETETGPIVSGPAGAGAGPGLGPYGPSGFVFPSAVPGEGDLPFVRSFAEPSERSARITALAQATVAAAPSIDKAVADAVKTVTAGSVDDFGSQDVPMSGGAEDDPMTGTAGAGSGAAPMEVESEFGPVQDNIGPDSEFTSVGGAELAAYAVGEALTAAYTVATSGPVRRAAGEFREAGQTFVDGLDTVVGGTLAYTYDAGGEEIAGVLVENVEEARGLLDASFRMVTGLVLLAFSFSSYAIGTAANVVRSTSDGIRALSTKLRSKDAKANSAKLITENSPLAILTVISVFNQLGMLPLVTIASMAAAGIQQQVSPVGRAGWLVYLFKWWVTRTPAEKEQVQEYLKTAGEKAATKGAAAAGAGATLVSDAIARAYKEANPKAAAPDQGVIDAKAKLARAALKKKTGDTAADKAAAKVLSEQAAIAMGILQIPDTDADAGASGASAKLKQLRKGVALAVEKAKRSSAGTATRAVEQEVPPTGDSARVTGRRRGRDEEGALAPTKFVAPGFLGSKIKSGTGPSGTATVDTDEDEEEEKPKKRKTRGGKRTKKAKRKTFRKKSKKTRGKTRSTRIGRKFVY